MITLVVLDFIMIPMPFYVCFRDVLAIYNMFLVVVVTLVYVVLNYSFISIFISRYYPQAVHNCLLEKSNPKYPSNMTMQNNKGQ